MSLVVIHKTTEEQMLEDFLQELTECDIMIRSADNNIKQRGINRKVVVEESINQLRRLREMPLVDRLAIPTRSPNPEEVERYYANLHRR